MAYVSSQEAQAFFAPVSYHSYLAFDKITQNEHVARNKQSSTAEDKITCMRSAYAVCVVFLCVLIRRQNIQV